MMPNITTETKKGKLAKVNGKWFVIGTRLSGLPIYELENESEQIADLTLVQKFNKPVYELEQLEVDWKYVVTDGVTNFGYEYAVLL